MIHLLSSPRVLRIGLALGILSSTLIAGCAPLIVGGAAATTAVVVTDRRTAGEQVEDKSIVMKIGVEMRKRFDDQSRINASSYAGLVLLTGDVPSEADKQAAGQIAQNVEKVKRVVNELRVGEPTPLSVRTNDTWLGSKVRTTLIESKGVPSRTISTTTERGVVYLMGKVTADEGELAAQAVAGINGINRVAKVFQTVSPQDAAEADGSATDAAKQTDAGSGSTSPATPSGTAAPGTEVQALPVQ